MYSIFVRAKYCKIKCKIKIPDVIERFLGNVTSDNWNISKEMPTTNTEIFEMTIFN